MKKFGVIAAAFAAGCIVSATVLMYVDSRGTSRDSRPVNPIDWEGKVTGKKQGKGYLKCQLNNIVATCLIDVESDDPGIETSEYYIYSQIEGAIEMAQGTSRSISVCLYNGTSDDYEDFTWRVVDSDVARISTARNNCEIYAKSCGSTQIIVSHPKAEYDFTFVVFSYMDLSNGIPYISTASNVVTNSQQIANQLGEKHIDRAMDVQPTITKPAGTIVYVLTNSPLALLPVDMPPVTQPYLKNFSWQN